MFRFTLGIPGFDDDLIPRVVGVVGAALLIGNHVLAGSPRPGAQVSSPNHRLCGSADTVLQMWKPCLVRSASGS